MHIELRRIQHDVCNVTDRIEPLPLRANRLHHRIASSHRMRPPRLREALYQRLFTRLQKHHARRQHLADVLQDRRKLIQPHPLTHINNKRRTFDLCGLPHQVRESRHQLKRQIIDRVIPKVLERLQRRQLSRPGKSSQNDQLAPILLDGRFLLASLRACLYTCFDRPPLDLLARHARNPSTPAYGTSISSIFPSRLRCNTIACPRWSRNTKTSRSRNAASFTASSKDIGRIATPSVERTTCGSASGECEGNECTSIGTALRPTLLFVASFTGTFAFRAPFAATSGFAPFTSAFGCRLMVPNFFLCRIACCSIFTSASRSAVPISVDSQRATSF